jgi:hypothetical protein
MTIAEESVNQRIKILIDHYADGVQRRFALKAGIQPTTLAEMYGKRGNKASVDTIQKIVDTYSQVRPEWLLNGEGEMLKSTDSDAQAQNISSYTPDRNVTGRNILSNIPTIKLRRLPFSGRASFNYPQIQRHHNTDIFEQVDFKIPKGRTPADYTDALVVDIEGDSMEKSLYDGDSVIAWPIPESKWEQLHNTICLIDYDDTATVKAILKNDLFTNDSLTLVATGGAGGSFTVARAAIHSIWEVRDFYEPRKVRLLI